MYLAVRTPTEGHFTPSEARQAFVTGPRGWLLCKGDMAVLVGWTNRCQCTGGEYALACLVCAAEYADTAFGLCRVLFDHVVVLLWGSILQNTCITKYVFWGSYETRPITTDKAGSLGQFTCQATQSYRLNLSRRTDPATVLASGCAGEPTRLGFDT
jgi:hypothetical protein